jgi:hypothetical protein
MRPVAIVLMSVMIAGMRAAAQDQPAANARLLEAARSAIKGREQQPAGQVFKNVQFLAGVPATTLLVIMDVGYSRGLGVNCTHCHDEQNFAGDDKRPKRAARETQAMHRAFNDRLQAMTNASTPKDQRFINCATCHRGKAIPESQ